MSPDIDVLHFGWIGKTISLRPSFITYNQRASRDTQMYIRGLHIGKFRHIENVELGPFYEPANYSDLVALAGPNGGGKSSILELLGFALSNSWSLSWSMSRSFPDNSFEVCISITGKEGRLVEEYCAQQGVQFSEDALKHIIDTGHYFRGFNLSGGEYEKEAPLYNKVHNLVTAALRNHYKRPLGFFIKSDRAYGSLSFARDRIFAYKQITTTDYAWSMAFNTSIAQYQDIFEYLVQQRYHYIQKLGVHAEKMADSPGTAGPKPLNPITEYNDLLVEIFPDYKFVHQNDDVPTNLFVQIPSGEEIPFHDLSSGEKEVFFILAFFLRQNVSNSVIIIDEPEMHLHPELARLLIRKMQSVKPGNQVWLATHNPEIVDEAGSDRTIYIDRDRETRKAIISTGADEPEAVRQLRNLFGFSGYIGVGKRMVFLEGTDASTDRKIFSRLFPEYGSDIRFISSQSVGHLMGVNEAILSILEDNVAWLDYYLIRDRDYLPDDHVELIGKKSKGRIYVLDRYHIENYVLDVEVISRVLDDIFGIQMSAEDVSSKFRNVCIQMSAEFLRDMISYNLNLAYRSEDFSLGRQFQNQSVFDKEGNIVTETYESLRTSMIAKIDAVNVDLANRTSGNQLEDLVKSLTNQIKRAIFDDDSWMSLFPGRALLNNFGKAMTLGKPAVFLNSLIKEIAADPTHIPEELADIISAISKGQSIPLD